MTVVALFFSALWLWNAVTVRGFRAAMLASLRSLDLANGVSALLPLLLVSIAGFLWAASAFRRVRMLEGFDNNSPFLNFSQYTFSEIETLEKDVRQLLQCPARDLPGVTAVFFIAIGAVCFFSVHVVRSFENGWFYMLLAVAFFCVNLALCLGVLRFFCVWRKTRRLLQHLALTPMRIASKRFRSAFRAWPKIDLATPAPSLAPLALAIDEATTLFRRAASLLTKSSPSGEFRLLMTMDGVKLETTGKTDTVTSPPLSQPERDDLEALGGSERSELADHIKLADAFVKCARQADAAGDWRQVIVAQSECCAVLALVVAKISEVLELQWWRELRPLQKKADASAAEPVYELAEELLAGRVSHFLAHVFPQMQILIYAPVVGVLLLLFAITSYPLQPHNLLLLFNSAVIAAFVIIAIWAFVEMNRDPILSNLNGTTPGRITWDKQFILRIIFYGVVPLLALLGAHFPDTVGQILSHFVPADSVRP